MDDSFAHPHLMELSNRIVLKSAKLHLLINESMGRDVDGKIALLRAELQNLLSDHQLGMMMKDPRLVTLKQAADLGLGEPQSIRNKMSECRKKGGKCKEDVPKQVGKSGRSKLYKYSELVSWWGSKQ